MPRWGMVIDLERCIGCQTCTVTCKVEHATPPGIHWARVLKKEVGTYPDARRVILPVLCMHCRKPACVEACPTGASIQRADGIVYVDSERCIGCRYCMMACPYQARAFSGEREDYFEEPTPYEIVARTVLGRGVPRGTVSKCTFCKERVDAGRLPACVETCLGSARYFGDLDDATSEVSRLLVARAAFQLEPEAGTQPSVFYLSRIPAGVPASRESGPGD